MIVFRDKAFDEVKNEAVGIIPFTYFKILYRVPRPGQAWGSTYPFSVAVDLSPSIGCLCAHIEL